MSTRVPTPGSGPAAMLTDVIRRRALSEDRITQIGADLAEIGARGLDTHDLVQRLQQRLGELVDAVQTLGGATDDLDEADDARPVDWSRLSREDAEREWQRLYDWLNDWLVPTYGITVTAL